MDTAVVGDGVVRTGHGQCAGRHAHRCAGRGPVVVAGQGTAHSHQAQVTQTLQGLSALHVLAGQRARACGGEGFTVNAGDAAEAAACKGGGGVVHLAARGRQVGFANGQTTVVVGDAVVAERGVAGARHQQFVGIGRGAGVGAGAVAADGEAVAALGAHDGGARVGLGRAVVGGGVVLARYSQGALRHAHAGARGAQCVVVGGRPAVGIGAHGQPRHAVQQLPCLHILAAQVGGVSCACHGECFTVDPRGCQK